MILLTKQKLITKPTKKACKKVRESIIEISQKMKKSKKEIILAKEIKYVRRGQRKKKRIYEKLLLQKKKSVALLN